MMREAPARRLWTSSATAVVALLLALQSSPRAEAQEFALVETPSANGLAVEQLKARTIAFNDHRQDPVADQNTGLIRFEDWARARPLQKQMLSLHPAYVEPTLTIKVDGVAKPVKEKLHMYVAEARFLVGKQPGDVARFATLAFLERLDPAIKHRVIAPGDTMSSKHPDASYLRHPAHEWCAAGMRGICVQSRYTFEGRLPVAIKLANKLRENARPVAEYVEFQSELRAVPVAEVDAANIAKLTGIATPITGVLEQNIFWVNQIMQFGRFLAVFQQHPADANKTVASAFMVLAVKSDVLERKKEYETVPVLRNMVPAQVLVGNSSFNTGQSISAGLPVYVRNRIKAIAAIMEKE